MSISVCTSVPIIPSNLMLFFYMHRLFSLLFLVRGDHISVHFEKKKRIAKFSKCLTGVLSHWLFWSPLNLHFKIMSALIQNSSFFLKCLNVFMCLLEAVSSKSNAHWHAFVWRILDRYSVNFQTLGRMHSQSSLSLVPVLLSITFLVCNSTLW